MRTASLAGRRGGESTGSHAISGAEVYNSLKHCGHDEGNAWIQNLFFLSLDVDDNVALRIPYRIDEHRRKTQPSIGKSGVSGGHVDRSCVIRAERHSWGGLHGCD